MSCVKIREQFHKTNCQDFFSNLRIVSHSYIKRIQFIVTKQNHNYQHEKLIV